MKCLKKLNYSELMNEDHHMKQYFKDYTLKDARTKFALETKMLETVKTHFSSDNEFSDDLWQFEAHHGLPRV